MRPQPRGFRLFEEEPLLLFNGLTCPIQMREFPQQTKRGRGGSGYEWRSEDPWRLTWTKIVFLQASEITVEGKDVHHSKSVHQNKGRAVSQRKAPIGLLPKQTPRGILDFLVDPFEPDDAAPKIFTDLDFLFRIPGKPRHQFVQDVRTMNDLSRFRADRLINLTIGAFCTHLFNDQCSRLAINVAIGLIPIGIAVARPAYARRQYIILLHCKTMRPARVVPFHFPQRVMIGRSRSPQPVALRL